MAFFAERLVHTKGRWARRAFVLEDWQEHDIIRPCFGEVVYSTEWKCYIRRYTVLYVVLGRKNGKSELAAGIVLYLLVGDDEEAAEIYGAAKDTKQAGKVAQVVERMRLLSPQLRQRLKFNKNERRIYDERTGSYYEVITAEALGELGHNPHGFILDEILSQPDDSLWNAMKTAAGARTQPLFVLITTETNAPASFGAVMIDEAERVQAQPRRAPHVLGYCRKTPKNADPWDESNWYHANPALGQFLTLRALREEALEAKNDPTKENAFRQFRLNQRVNQVTRHMPMHLWDACGRALLDKMVEQVTGKACFGGLDLASTTDLAALCWLFPWSGTKDEPHRALWRYWTPEAQVAALSKHTGGQFELWVKAGLVKVTDGDWIDFDQIRDDIAADLDGVAKRALLVGYDPAQAPDMAQWLIKRRGDDFAVPVKQGYALSGALQEIMRLTKAQGIEHAGNPVSRWNADGSQVTYPRDDPDTIKLVKPQRLTATVRIDGYAAFADAMHTSMHAPALPGPAQSGSMDDGGSLFKSGSRLAI